MNRVHGVHYWYVVTDLRSNAVWSTQNMNDEDAGATVAYAYQYPEAYEVTTVHITSESEA